MIKQRLLPDRMKVLSGSALKLIAVIAMLIDHIASHLVPKSIMLIDVGRVHISLYFSMRLVGRIAFPLFAFLLVEGFLHTRNRIRYGASLMICALVSEIPWDLVHGGKLVYHGQNVFFTLLLGYVGLYVIERLKQKPVPQIILLIVLGAMSVALQADYSIHGYAFIILLYALREYEIFRVFANFTLDNHWYSLLAFIPISMYNGKRGFIKGPVLKYIFYLFYPAHLLVIYFIKLAVGKL